jgi:uncharacterized membrane protein HdeD (DUF308 family)
MSRGFPSLKPVADEHDGRPRHRQRPEGLPRPLLEQIARYWWVELLAGAFWVVIAVVVLKFNHASVVTVGVLTGIMFLLFALEEFALAALDLGARWLWGIFGVLMTAAGIVALIHPVNTFLHFADILGFVFLLIGFIWMIHAFYERPLNDLWWLTLISGILMVVVAFWVSSQYLLARAYTLLVFAGVWAAMAGITHIVRAFQIRRLGSLVEPRPPMPPHVPTPPHGSAPAAG